MRIRTNTPQSTASRTRCGYCTRTVKAGDEYDDFANSCAYAAELYDIIVVPLEKWNPNIGEVDLCALFKLLYVRGNESIYSRFLHWLVLEPDTSSLRAERST